MECCDLRVLLENDWGRGRLQGPKLSQLGPDKGYNKQKQNTITTKEKNICLRKYLFLLDYKRCPSTLLWIYNACFSSLCLFALWYAMPYSWVVYTFFFHFATLPTKKTVTLSFALDEKIFCESVKFKPLGVNQLYFPIQCYIQRTQWALLKG